MIRTITIILLLGLTTLNLGGCDAARAGGPQSQPPVAAVDVAEVLAEPAVFWSDFTGRVAAPQTVELRPRVSGYIQEVAFAEGEQVRQGAVLFVIDPRPYQAREREAAARLAHARSQLKLEETQAGRAEQLLDSRAVSRVEYDQRVAARDSARAAVAAAEAALESARLDLQYTEVTAPISGRIGRALVTRGNLATADDTRLTTIASMDPMHVYFESDQQTFVSSRALFDPAGRPPVRVGVAGEQGYPHVGQLDFIDNQLNSRTGTIQFRAVVPNPDGNLLPGQFARVQVPVERHQRALLVNRRAVLTDQDRRYVFVVNEHDRVERRDVETGPALQELIQVRQGLAAGERVVVNGLQKIQGPGEAVHAQLVDMRLDQSPSQLAAR